MKKQLAAAQNEINLKHTQIIDLKKEVEKYKNQARSGKKNTRFLESKTEEQKNEIKIAVMETKISGINSKIIKVNIYIH